MAASDCPQGYQCKFIDSVPEDFYCKKCTLVARQLTFTSCCGESYCHACITDIQEQGKPCPACKKEAFTTVELMKYQKKVNQLQVYCSMKERGCDWSGTLERLDAHQDNCQYVDTKCPLNCHMTIPKNKVEHHVAQHCAKRPYVCHVPLQCPHLCEVTFERDFMEDHMKMCHLQKVRFGFSGVGCDGWFIREDHEEHTRQNSQKHLTLTPSLAVETKEQLQLMLLEQDKKHKEEEEKLRHKVEEQEKKMEEQEKRLIEQEKKLNEQQKKHEVEKRFQDQDRDHKEEKKTQEKRLIEQEKKLNEQQKKNEVEKSFQDQDRDHKEEKKTQEQRERQKELEQKFLKLSRISYNQKFKMESFSKEKAQDLHSTWKSPAKYTHVSGYQFCIGVDANGRGLGRGKSIYVAVWGVPGKFDDQLKWPAKANFTIELINQQGGENATCTTLVNLERSMMKHTFLASFQRITIGGGHAFLENSLLYNFLNDDTLFFHVSEIHLL